MKIIPLLFFLALAACERNAAPYELFSEGRPFKIDPAVPPEGMHLVQILLNNQFTPVTNTLCARDANDKRPLQRYLAQMLGGAIDPGQTRTFKLHGGCETDWFETASGARVDYWRCNVGITNIGASKDDEMEAANIYFGITQDEWKFIPEKLICG